MSSTLQSKEMRQMRSLSRQKATSVTLMLVLFSSLAAQALPANANAGIGGGPTFINGSEFPFVGGVESSLTSAFFVQNIGTEEVDLEIIYNAPDGVTIEPSEGQDTVLGPGESTYFRFDITVGNLVPAGNYNVSVNLRQSAESTELGSGSNYLPALSGRFTISIIGASASANISAISALNGGPAFGNLSLFYLGENGLETLIFETEDSSFDIRLVPGNFKATFDVPNLQTQEKLFSIEDGEQIDVVLEIPTIEFIGTGAVPTRDDRGAIQFVVLTMDVYNNLRPITGPVEFLARITRDGEFVEDFTIATIPVLPEAETLQRATYNPESGFPEGAWEFQFIIQTDDFNLASPGAPVVNSPGLLQSYIREILLAVGALLIIALAIPRSWWAIIFKKRRKQTEQVDEIAPAKKISRPRISLGAFADLKDKVKLPPVPDFGSGLSETSDKATAFLSGIFKRVERDPFEKLLELRREKEKLEDGGARTLAFNYDLDGVFAKDPQNRINRSTGEPYTEDEISRIERYKKLKEQVERIQTPELDRKATRILLDERLARRKEERSGA